MKAIGIVYQDFLKTLIRWQAPTTASMNFFPIGKRRFLVHNFILKEVVGMALHCYQTF
jgi:hypothetical protein